MGDKEDKDHRMVNLSSNPFSLPGTVSAPSQVFGTASTSTSKINSGKTYNVMTSSTTTLARNLFAGSSDVTSSTSRMYPVTSLQGSSFGGSAFRSFDSSGSFSASALNRPSGIFGTVSTMAHSVPGTFPFSDTNISQNVSKQTSSPNIFGIASGAGSGFSRSGIGGSDSQALACTSIPSIFGKGTSTSSFTVGQSFSQARSLPSEYSSTCNSFPTSTVFGVSPSISQSKEQSSNNKSLKESSAFPGLTGTATQLGHPNQASTSTSFVCVPKTTGSETFALKSKAPGIFGGNNTRPLTSKKEVGVAETSKPRLFGGISDNSLSSVKSSSNASFSSSHPPLFGGASGSKVAQDSLKIKTSGTSASVLFCNIPSQQPFGKTSMSQNVESSFAASNGGSSSSSFTTPSLSFVFGGNTESPSLAVKTVENTAPSSVASVFGGPAGNSSGFISTTSTLPFFGKLPSTSLLGGASADGIPSVSAPNISQHGTHTAEVARNVFGVRDDCSKSSSRQTVSSLPVSSVPAVFGGKTTDMFISSSTTFSTAAGQPGKLSSFPTSDVPVKTAEAAFKSKPDVIELTAKESASKTTVFGGPTTDPSCVPNLFSGVVFGGVQKSSAAVQFPVESKDSPVCVTSNEQIVVSTVSTVTSSEDEQNIVTSSKNVAATTGILFGGPQLDSHIPDSTLNNGKMKAKVKHREEKLKNYAEKQKGDVSLSKKSVDLGQPSFLEQKGKQLDSSLIIFGDSKTDASSGTTVFGGNLFGGVQQPTLSGQVAMSVEDSGQSSVTSSVFGGSVCSSQMADIDHSTKDKRKTRDKNKKEEKHEQELPKEKHEQEFPLSKNADDKSDPVKKGKNGKEGEVQNLLLSDDLFDIFGKDDSKLVPTSPMTNDPPVDKKDITKIIIAQIPECCMDKDIIKNHFEKFGHVKRVFLNPKSNQATVQYEDHRGAARAKKKGQKIHPILPEVKIFYGAPARRKSEENTTDAMLSKKKAIKTLQQTQTASSVKSPGDIDPYTPLERPSVAPPTFLSSKTVKKEVLSKNLPPKQLPVAMKSKAKVSKQEDILKSAKPFSKESSPKITRLDSPKSAKLKVEDKQMKSRSVSPGREYNVFAEIKSMKPLLELQALTSNDRYNVLKARDKLMRNEKKRIADISKATSLDAMCPDMCPELERYMRDVQNDLSSFEMTDGLLDHKLVVKKFSRSSADKEEPLPHELRPGPVLLRTMDFLMCNMMVLCDRKDVDVGIWYNYLWDRTRAIRGDITQQQLTNELAVTILERCVRFHIYAAVHLCEESPDVFDRKLNTENLTKSLQTLKELYKDLAEMGKFFPSECEFRAYEMLLHLNDGEKIVHQYSQYRDEVQKSLDVIYALKVFLALKSNNYVRFFKLIRSGTYLQGCILHRYFQQVRSKALDTYVKAYVVTKQLSLPLSVMIHTLGFEDESDAQSYLNYHCIKVEEGNVVLDKNLIDLHPEGQPPVTRPLKLIESNRRCSVAEIIQGGSLPENPLHSYVPHNSFDEQGYLKKEARDASDQWLTLQSQFPGAWQATPSSTKESQTSDTSRMLFVNEISEVHPPDKNKPQESRPKGLSESNLLGFERDIFNHITSSVISTMMREVAKDCIKEVQNEQVKNLAVRAVSSDILSDCIKREAKDIGKDAFKEVRQEVEERKRKEKKEAERKQKEFERIQHNSATFLCGEYTDEVIVSMLRIICQESLSEIAKEVQCKVFDIIMKELPPEVIKEVVQEEVHKLGNEVFSELSLELEEKIQELQNKILVRKMSEYFRRWRKAVLQARRRKQSQATFPASCSQLSLEEQNKELSWGYSRKSSENISAESLFKEELENIQISEKMIVRDRLLRAVSWYPLPFQYEMKKLVECSLQPPNIIHQYFKLLLCTNMNSNSTILQWLRSKLNGVENGDTQNPLQYSFSFTSRRSGLEYGFSFCEASLDAMDHKGLSGVSAVLFVTQDVGEHSPDYVTLQKLIKATPGLLYQSIVAEEDSVKSKDAWLLLEDDILVPETSQKLLDVVLQMWNEYAKRFCIVSATLNNFVSGIVASHYIEPSLLKQQERWADGKSPLLPVTYLELYNAVITFLVGVIEDKEVSQLDWPPPELGNLRQIPPSSWNKSDVRKNVEHVKYMKLPVIELEGFMQWKGIVNSLYSYVDQVSQPEKFSVELWSRVHCILSSTSKKLEATYNLDMEDPDLEVHILLLPWTELIYACVSYKLSHLTDACVFYQPKSLKAFTCPKSWWAACDKSDPSFVKTFSEEGMVVNSRKRRAADDDEELHEETKMPKLSSELLQDIAREREKFEEFQKRLETTLEDSSDIVWKVIARDGEQRNPNNHEAFELTEEQNKHHMEPLQSSNLLSDLAREKEKFELFQRKLESMLDDGEDLNFLFKDS